MSHFARIAKNVPMWLRYGMTGILGLVLASTADYIFCRKTNCRLGALTEYTARASETMAHQIGRALGARYQYIPYFPSHATQIFLSVLDILTPLLIWFVLGVLTYFIVRLVRRNSVRSRDERVKAS